MVPEGQRPHPRRSHWSGVNLHDATDDLAIGKHIVNGRRFGAIRNLSTPEPLLFDCLTDRSPDLTCGDQIKGTQKNGVRHGLESN
jgi:hypothetical protein